MRRGRRLFPSHLLLFLFCLFWRFSGYTIKNWVFGVFDFLYLSHTHTSLLVVGFINDGEIEMAVVVY